MPRPSPAKDCLAHLSREPLPLYSEVLDVAVLWNAKAGCTFAIKWLLFQEGLLEEAEGYAPWIHQYRQQVYCKRPGYTKALRRIPELGARAVKFVRDPFDRAVGAYLAYSQQAYRLASEQHKPMLRAIGSHLGRPVGEGRLFSFREFVSFLGTVDLGSANIHVRRQVHWCEIHGALPDMTVIRVEDAETALPRLETVLRLKASDFSSLRHSSHHTRRVADRDFCGDAAYGRTVGTSVPASSAFYDPKLTAAVAELYRVDFEAYGYATTMSPGETKSARS